MKRILVIGLLVSACVAVFLSPFASSSPDGLERVAEDKGFLHQGEASQPVRALIPGYAFPGVKREGLATALAGFAGTMATFMAVLGLGSLLRMERKKDGSGSPSGR